MRRLADFAPLAAFAVLAACLYPLQRWIDAADAGSSVDAEALFLSNGESIRRLSLGYEGLLSDVYWMRTIQYFGTKVTADPHVLDVRSQRLKLLYPLTDVTTSLDPRYLAAYRFGGFFVHDYVDETQSYALLEKGIANNPQNWQLHQDLAFLYWTDGRCDEAARVYEKGSDLPGAPGWMKAMGAAVLADCGNIDTAMAMYEHVIGSTGDERVRNDAAARLASLRAQREVEFLRSATAAYRAATGQFPPSLAALLSALQRDPRAPRLTLNAANEPVDPGGTPYAYDPATGNVGPAPGGVPLPVRVMPKR